MHGRDIKTHNLEQELENITFIIYRGIKTKADSKVEHTLPQPITIHPTNFGQGFFLYKKPS